MNKSILVVLAVLGTSLYAQDFRATLSGQVTDPSHSAIPNAMVRATNLDNNAVKETKTANGGKKQTGALSCPRSPEFPP